MSDRIKGTATYKCSNCGAKHFLHNQDFFFEAESGSERGMGGEVQHSFEYYASCHNCDREIHIKFKIWEYPVGIINMINEDTKGAEILESSFNIQNKPQKEDHDEAVNLVKSLVLFRFEAFAETFVDYWIKSYKKSPQPTKIISFAAFAFAIFGLVLGVYLSDNARTAKLEKKQTYTEQFDLLKSTEKNLNEISIFITSKKSEIETTKTLIQELESKKSELEPIVTANQKVVDAIFLQQKKEVEKTIWIERLISFGLGVLASLFATVIWQLVGRLKKEKF